MGSEAADPTILARIMTALGPAPTVYSASPRSRRYEPLGHEIIDSNGSNPTLELSDRSVDASIALLAVHHWRANAATAVRELRRISRGVVLILTFDPVVLSTTWLFTDYLPELAARELQRYPPLHELRRWLDGRSRIHAVPLSRTTNDLELPWYWAHPETLLARWSEVGGVSGVSAAVRDRALTSLRRDLANGHWFTRHGHLRSLEAYDVGLRLLVNERE